jgi:hypothetical protein
MELIKKMASDEYMPESQVRALQLRIGKTAKALEAGKTVEEIAEILKSDVATAEEYIRICKEADNYRPGDHIR